MSLFSEKTLENADKFNKPFPLFKEDRYILRVTKVEVCQVDGRTWTNGVGVPNGEKEDRVKFTVIMNQADGAWPKELDFDATAENHNKAVFKESETNGTVYLLNPLSINVSKQRGPAKGNQFLVAALDLSPDKRISLEDLSGWIEDGSLVGKEVLAMYTLSFVEGKWKGGFERFSSAKK